MVILVYLNSEKQNIVVFVFVKSANIVNLHKLFRNILYLYANFVKLYDRRFSIIYVDKYGDTDETPRKW